MDISTVVFGALISVAGVGALYILTMIFYFILRRTKFGVKRSAEIIVGAFAYLLSVFVRYFVVVLELKGSGASLGLWDSVSLFCRSIYSGIGGFAFEGLDDYANVSSVVNCVYAGTSLYTGLVALTVISTNVSHVIYSKILLKFKKFGRALKSFLKVFFPCVNNDVDIYVFTAITDDALALAESIELKHKQSKKLRPEIIFSGAELEAFDKKNPLHAKIITHGYLYIPFKKSFDNQSIIKYFNYFIKNDGFLAKDKFEFSGRKNAEKKAKNYIKKNRSQSKIHIFALELNEDKTGLEELNSSVIFDEIESILKLKAVNKNKILLSTVIDFYVLVDGDVSYEHYTSKLNGLITSAVKDGRLSDDATSSAINICKNYFQLHVINEAEISAECMIEGRNQVFASDTSLYEKDNSRLQYKTLVLGFGENGRACLNSLFINTAYIDDSGNPTKFSADVYDTRISEISGPYTYSHPFYKVANVGEKVSADQSDFIDADKNIKPFFAPGILEKRVETLDKNEIEYLKDKDPEKIKSWLVSKEREAVTDYCDVDLQMGFPEIALHNLSCLDSKFINYLDEKVDAFSEKISNKYRYNSIIVTLGNDETNILTANNIINSIKRELDVSKKNYIDGLLIIYINLRNKFNHGRIDWTESDAEKYPNLKVISFGEVEKTYSYDFIVSDEKEKKYNTFYSLIYLGEKISDESKQEISKMKRDFRSIVNEYSEDKDFECTAIFENAKKIILSNGDFELADKLWAEQSLFIKKSNNYARKFAPALKSFAKSYQKSGLSREKVINLAKIEHVRWNRFHMAHGWVFVDYEKKDKARARLNREHDCLVPFSLLNVKDSDVLNIAVAYAENEE